jgi:putrescine transport system permease protein
VAVWGGWSTRWYAELFNDAPLVESAVISLRLALAAATAATILGTLAALALSRFGRFRGWLPFTAMIYAPLVMPEVVTGLSLLLLFVAVAADRGFWTVAIAHTTMAMCFVTVIVQSRLANFDMSLEEAAMDLGAPPLRTFLSVTLPLIVPAIAAAWMLAFALSLDDLVIASFTTGPGTTTLPIRIYSEVRLGVKPEINAVCSIMIGVVGTAVIIASLLAKLAGARGAAARV